MLKTTAMRNLKMKAMGASKAGSLPHMLLLLAAAAGMAHATTQGPDGGGYTATDQTPYSFNDISGSGASILAGIDDGAVALTLPFLHVLRHQLYKHLRQFQWRGLLCHRSEHLHRIQQQYSQRCIEYGSTATPAPGDLPGVFPFWTDLDFSPAGADGLLSDHRHAGQPQFIIQWNAAYPLGDSVTVTSQAILAEGTNSITFQYSNVALGGGDANNNGALATVAIRNAGGQKRCPAPGASMELRRWRTLQ